MYEKDLKRGKDGLFVRYIGRNDKGNAREVPTGLRPPCRREASAAHRRPMAESEERTIKGYKPFWEPKSLEAAKAIAKGMPPTLPKRDFEDPIKYVRRLSEISKATGTRFEPMDPEGHQSGMQGSQIQMEKARRSLSASLRLKRRPVSPSGRRWRPMPHSSSDRSDSPTDTSSPGDALGSTSLIRSGVTSPTKDSAEETTWHSTSPN